VGRGSWLGFADEHRVLLKALSWPRTGGTDSMRPSNERRRSKGSTNCGRKDDEPLWTYEDVVMDYRNQYRPNHEHEREYYASRPSLEEAVDNAARAKNSEGKRSSHQRRLKQVVLDRARRRLMACDFRACKSFDEIFDLVSDAVHGIHGIGPLTIYDTALKIGSFLDRHPARVYLHSGTRIGARALLDVRGRETIELSEVPKAFRVLPPRQIEDCLCIYKDEIAEIASRE
jgi:hypothetical protein